MTTRTATTVRLDMARLWEACVVRFARLDTDAKHTADLLGFTPSVFTRIKKAARGQQATALSADVLLSICWWLDRNPLDFRVLHYPPPGDPPPEETEP